jgi:two-component system phosphate regulon response regulator PhoB
MAQVLVVEDEADLREVLRYNLSQAGHQVRVAGTGTEGLRLARENRPDLVLLDAMLPDMAGTEVCKLLKRDSHAKGVRVMMVTARGEEIDRVVAFELGADDYVVKPFSIRELILRAQAVLRVPTELASGNVLVFGSLRIDRLAHRVWVEEDEVALTAMEFRLLVTLLDRKNRVQTRSMLLADVWRMGGALETRTVDTHVKRLREKLVSAGCYIETVRGAGYRFCEEPPDAPPPSA